jgi:hypothetical protein
VYLKEGTYHTRLFKGLRLWQVVSWVDILLDVIGGVESALREGCPRTMTGVSQLWFSGHFQQVFFNTIALPRINIDADVWGESSIMTGVYQHWCSSTLHIGWGLCNRVCQVLVCRGRYSLGGVGSSLHSGVEFGRSSTREGSSGARKKGVV